MLTLPDHTKHYRCEKTQKAHLRESINDTTETLEKTNYSEKHNNSRYKLMLIP